MAIIGICFSLLSVYIFIPFLVAEQDVDCRLTPTREDISTEFRLKASEKGVRLVYLNLEVGNDSYHPLELADEFLPARWVWAKSIEERMLSLPENYDVLSLGLLKRQVTSLDVHLEDTPTGCVASLNSSSQNIAIGKMLLQYVTIETNSSDLQSQVVCVEMIKGNNIESVEYQCCDKLRDKRFKSYQVVCDKSVGRSHWVELVDYILSLLAFFLSLYIPAFPLTLPDYVFSLQHECDKEDRLMEDRGQQANSLLHLRNGYIEIEEDCRIAVDDASPMTVSTLLFRFVQRMPDLRFSFNFKLAFMLFFIYPLFIYVQLGLTLMINKRFLDEISRKNFIEILNSSSSFITYYGGTVIIGFFISSVFFLVLLLRPKDLLLPYEIITRCFVCKVALAAIPYLRLNSELPNLRPSLPGGQLCSIGDAVCFYLSILQQVLYEMPFFFTRRLLHAVNKLFMIFMCSVKVNNRKVSRLGSALCVLWIIVSVYFTLLVALAVGAVFIIFYIVTSVFCIVFCSPLLTVLNAFGAKILITLAGIYGKSHVLRRTVGFLTFLLFYSMLYQSSFRLVNFSCSFVTDTIAYTILGIVLNAQIVTPYAAFFLVVVTNIYLCFANFQNRYKEVKEMISACQYELHMNIGSCHTEDTIPTRLYWFVCSRVLQVKSQICRMLCNAASILIFLFSVVFSIAFYGSENEISAVISVIAVVLTGVVPSLLLKLFTEGKSFRGLEKVNLKSNIHSAVELFYQESRGENTTSHRVNIQTIDNEQV